MSGARLVQEALVVGLVTVLAVAVVHGGEMAANAVLTRDGLMHHPQSHREYMVRLVVIAFLAGVLAHFGLEVSGGNEFYCKRGVACSK